MTTSQLKAYYERTAHRFWDPGAGLVGRDAVVYPLLDGLKGSLLEYGCGAGSLLLTLAREERFTSACGVDISETVLANVAAAVARFDAGVQKKIRLIGPESDRLPGLPDRSVDVIVSVATLEHVIDPYQVLDEFHRIARDGGTLLCSVPNYGYIKHRIALLFGSLPRTGTDEPVERWREAGWDGMHLHTFTQSAFATLLEDCGWQPCVWTGWGERFGWMGRLRQWFPGLLSGEIIARCIKKQK
ncbi:MAG: class I SAM-dependent methyltransferase [Steroidobacteraceae bacterium]|jgi:SAM-dependent methyltransferase